MRCVIVRLRFLCFLLFNSKSPFTVSAVEQGRPPRLGCGQNAVCNARLNAAGFLWERGV